MFHRREDPGPLIGNPQYNKEDDEEGMEADRRARVSPMADKWVFVERHVASTLA